MWFYEAQRSGQLPKNNRVSWRHDSCEDDGSDNNVTLSGGYYDAGDYLKFTVPLSHSLTLLAWGGIEWFDAYERTNQTSYLRNTLRWGTDWLIAAHPEPKVLFVQVGDGEIDNDYWGPDTDVAYPRPSYMINSTAPGTDVAALTSAALSSASYLFRHKFNDANYANELLHHAKDLFNFAETATPWQTYSNTSVPEAADYYSTNRYHNQLLYGCLWMFKATGNSSYLEKSDYYFDLFQDELYPTIMDWSDQTGAALILGASLNDTTSKFKNASLNYFDSLLDTSSNDSVCTYTYGGLFWCDGNSNSNSVLPPLNTALLMALFQESYPEVLTNYTEFIRDQLGYLLGDNKMLTPYICGIHKNSPHNPHHAGASGGTDIGKINSSPKVEAHILYGAVVGGPDKDDNFYDIREDYVQTEVALDYNAPFQSLIAYQIHIGAGDPPYVNITEDRPYITRDGPEHFAGWKIAVIVVVTVVGLSIIGLAIWYWRRRNRRSTENESSTFSEKITEAEMVAK
ncbi:glycoside hydrolase family 9 protein [Backusella circina FSU 941]|nr:glycoside hydrolase family 9 protein [Backusella circina FSU 941]